MRFKSDIQNLLHVVRQKLDAGKAEHITILDLRSTSSLADAMLIATGTSTRHVMALAHHLAADLKKQLLPLYNDIDQGDGNWIVLDLGALLVHLFTAEARLRYDLEGLWHPKGSIRSRKAPRKSA